METFSRFLFWYSVRIFYVAMLFLKVLALTTVAEKRSKKSAVEDSNYWA